MSDRLEWLNARLNGFSTRLVLSVAIIGSLVVRSPPQVATWLLVALFGTELLARTFIWGAEARQGRPSVPGGLLLLIDALAVVSFLPLDFAVENLRFGRIARLVLLLSYWGPLFRDFVQIATERQRLSQVLLVSALALLLTGIGASLLRFVDTSNVDIDGNGAVTAEDAQPNYRVVLWWAFRQVEDPGNLVSSTDNGWLVILSLLLTISGLLLVAVLIGVGTTLVEDLVRAGRARPVGLRGHMVVLNVSDDSRGILENITTYFAKQVRRHRIAVQGPKEERPDFMEDRRFRGFDYRHGPTTHPDTLALVDVDRAQRVAVLSPGEDARSDAEAVTTVMSVRKLNPDAWIVVELNRPTNLAAAQAAGTSRTIPVPARRLAALVLAQELVDPGRSRVLLNLVSLEGQELYTCVLNDGRLMDTPATLLLNEPFGALRRRVMHQHHCLLLGYFAADGTHHTGQLLPVLNPPPSRAPGRVRGVIALAPRFSELESAVRELVADRMPPPPEAPPVLPVPLAPEPRLDPRHILVLGFHDDTVETVGELLRVFDHCDVTVVCRSEDERTHMRNGFVAERTETGMIFEVLGPKQLEIALPGGRVGHVHLRVGDRYADGLFRPGDSTGRVGNVFDYDALVLLTERDDDDPDAATVLAVLKLLETPFAGHRLRHVVAEFRAPELAHLLRERATRAGRGDISFVCTSLLREDILNHSFFVPGLPPVLYDLMTAGDNELWAFNPTQSSGTTTFDALITALQQRNPPLTVVGYTNIHGELAVNPPPNTVLEWSQVHTVYCLAIAPDLDGSGAPSN